MAGSCPELTSPSSCGAEERFSEHLNVDLDAQPGPRERAEAALRAGPMAATCSTVQSFMKETVRSASGLTLAARWATLAVTRSPPRCLRP